MDRLLAELNQKLSAKVTKYYQDESLGDHEDNATQMRAVELLADILGVKKREVKISGEIKNQYKPRLDLSHLSDSELDEFKRLTSKAKTNGEAARRN